MNRINCLSLTKGCMARCILYIALFSAFYTNSSAQIIADHTIVEQYQDIPDQYIAEIKKMLITFAGESHSGAYRDGLTLLMAQNAKFAAEVSETGYLPAYTTTALRCSRQINTGSGWASTTGESRWYANAASRSDIKNHIQYCKTNNLNLSVVGFGWCWDMSWQNAPSGTVDPDYNVRWGGSSEGGPEGNKIWGLNAADQALTGNSVCMDTYFEATMEYLNYCISNNINTKVVFTTGPIDDDGVNKGERGYQRAIKNDYIRDYVRNSPNNLILFDFADILAYNNAGQRQTTTWNSNTYEFIHNDNLLMLDGSPMNTGYHFGERGALRIGKALWWLLARIAGWDGNSTPDTQAPSAPTNLTSSNLSATSVKLSWTASTDNVGVTGYVVYRGSDSITTVTTTSHTVTGLTASTSYTFTVKAKDAAKNKSTASNVLTISTPAATDITKPSVPQNLTASNLTHNSVKLSWSASTDNVGVTGYTVFRGTDSLTTVTTLSYTVTGLSAATAYSFAVRARDAAKNRSNANTPVNITTLPATALNEIGEEVQSSLIKDLPYIDNNQLIINLTEPSKSAIKIEIFSISGINVHSQIIKAAGSNISIEIPEIKPGVYILKVSNKTKVYKGKLLKL